jgi:hypothetical protein
LHLDPWESFSKCHETPRTVETGRPHPHTPITSPGLRVPRSRPLPSQDLIVGNRTGSSVHPFHGRNTPTYDLRPRHPLMNGLANALRERFCLRFVSELERQCAQSHHEWVRDGFRLGRLIPPGHVGVVVATAGNVLRRFRLGRLKACKHVGVGAASVIYLGTLREATRIRHTADLAAFRLGRPHRRRPFRAHGVSSPGDRGRPPIKALWVA